MVATTKGNNVLQQFQQSQEKVISEELSVKLEELVDRVILSAEENAKKFNDEEKNQAVKDSALIEVLALDATANPNISKERFYNYVSSNGIENTVGFIRKSSFNKESPDKRTEMITTAIEQEMPLNAQTKIGDISKPQAAKPSYKSGEVNTTNLMVAATNAGMSVGYGVEV